jgi:hypothetical protein
MTTQSDLSADGDAAEKRALIRRLDGIRWGLLFLIIGFLWLLPDHLLPKDKWVPAAAVGAGIILLGENAVRNLAGIRSRAGSTHLGVLAVAYGVGRFYGVDFPFFVVAFMLVGAAIILFPRKGSRMCG